MPRVSVIIPTFNCAPFLTRALESVFAQSYTDYEVIVADDGSTDETRELVMQWEGKVRYLHQSNHGVSAARNLAVSKASGEFLAYLDADDMYYPHRLEMQVAFLDAHAEYGLVHSDVTIVDENDHVISSSFNRETGRSVPTGDCILDLLQNCHIQTPSVTERRVCFNRTGGFEKRLSFAEDYLHWTQVALHGFSIGYIDEPLAMYRRRPNSASASHSKMAEGLLEMLCVLLEGNALREPLGAVPQQVIRSRMDKIERSLPYVYRSEGRIDLARRKAIALVLKSPTELDPYVELMKSCLFPLARAMRGLRKIQRRGTSVRKPVDNSKSVPAGPRNAAMESIKSDEAIAKIRKSYAFALPWAIDHLGGVNEVVRNLMEEFRAAGEFHPVLIESHWASARPAVERRPGYTHIRMRLRALNDTNIKALLAFCLLLPFTLRNLRHLANEYRIDAINFHFPSLYALNWIALQKLRLFPGKVILSFHGSDIRGAHRLRGWARSAYRYLLRQADVVVSCSEGLQSEILALEPRARTRVIYNGIDEGRFRGEALPTMLPTNLQQRELILTIGKYEYRKAHDLLLRAFAQVLEKRPAACLVIAGATGPEIDKTKAAVFDSGLAEHVTLYHDLPHTAIPGLLACADLFVLSSRWVPGELGEGFPVVILEAAVAGKPVITTLGCGAAEIIEDGVTGRLVALEDAGALAEAMCELLQDKGKARFMAENLRRKVLDEFTWKRAYRSYAGFCRAT